MGIRQSLLGSSLLGDAAALAFRVVKGELALAEAEMSRSVRQAGVGLGLVAGGAILAITGLNLLAAALVAGVVHAGLSPAWGSVVVGVIFALMALIIAREGVIRLSRLRLMPVRAMRGLRQDARLLERGLKP